MILTILLGPLKMPITRLDQDLRFSNSPDLLAHFQHHSYLACCLSVDLTVEFVDSTIELAVVEVHFETTVKAKKEK